MKKRWIILYRIFFSAPMLMVFVILLLLMRNATINGEPITVEEWLIVSIIIYVIFLFPINLVIRLIERRVLKISFGELLGRPLFHLFSKGENSCINDKSCIERFREAKDGFSVKILWAEILYFIDRILFPPAKAMFIIWSICWGATYISNKNIPQNGELIVIFVGYLVYCGITDLIYHAFQKRYYA